MTDLQAYLTVTSSWEWFSVRDAEDERVDEGFGGRWVAGNVAPRRSTDGRPSNEPRHVIITTLFI